MYKLYLSTRPKAFSEIFENCALPVFSCFLGSFHTIRGECDENTPPTTSTAWVKGNRNSEIWYFSEKFSQDWSEFLAARPRNFEAAQRHCKQVYEHATLAIPDTEAANDDLGDLISEYSRCLESCEIRGF